MGRRSRRSAADLNCVEADEMLRIINHPPSPILIVGAGSFLRDIIELLDDYPELEPAGILDPNPQLKGQSVNGIPIVGWMGGIVDCEASIVIGTPSVPQAFDREAVFHMLLKRGMRIPVLRAVSSRCAPDVTIPRGAIILKDSIVESRAVMGENCLVGVGAIVRAYVELAEHTVVPSGEEVAFDGASKSDDAKPRSLAATLTPDTTTIQEIIRRINWACMEIMLVVDGEGRLVGTVTDGDIRRGILASVDLTMPVTTIMNSKPISVPIGSSHSMMIDAMKRHSIRHVPVVDNEGRPVRLETIEHLLEDAWRHDAIVMAGGLGTRLRPLTKKTPKPLLHVAGKPILDHILTGLHDSGLQDVVISVNYLGERIREHVGDGSRHDLNVEYLSEGHRLGTAGALSMLRPRPRRPFLVMNGDLLTNMNFANLLRFQQRHGHAVVMCVRKQDIQIPYGVVDIEEDVIVKLREKPVYHHFINAGIYVLDPSCIDLIPRDEFFDMTDLINCVVRSGHKVGAFPVIEYWRDIATPKDLTVASVEQKGFKTKSAESLVQGAALLPAS